MKNPRVSNRYNQMALNYWNKITVTNEVGIAVLFSSAYK